MSASSFHFPWVWNFNLQFSTQGPALESIISHRAVVPCVRKRTGTRVKVGPGINAYKGLHNAQRAWAYNKPRYTTSRLPAEKFHLGSPSARANVCGCALRFSINEAPPLSLSSSDRPFALVIHLQHRPFNNFVNMDWCTRSASVALRGCFSNSHLLASCVQSTPV